MRKLKLEIQMSIDGFIADPAGNMNWMVWPYNNHWVWDEELRRYHTDLVTSSDCILLSRKMAEDGFINHWEDIARHPLNPQAVFAKPVAEMQKIVFTTTLTKSMWKNTEIAKGNFIDKIKELKNQKGKDLIVYGGATFVSSLIKSNLIDELHLLINPTAIGKGLTIFKGSKSKKYFRLIKSKSFDCGVVLLHYESVLKD
jgi:dihydrofolate reductase